MIKPWEIEKNDIVKEKKEFMPNENLYYNE